MHYAVLIPMAGLALAACGTSTIPTDRGSSEQTPILEPTQRSADLEVLADQSETAAPDPDLVNPRVEEFDSYLPPRLIGLDGIRPVYEPRFVAVADAPLEDDELVIGISIEGQAKAYPITVLRFREMVNDELGGLPILVTW